MAYFQSGLASVGKSVGSLLGVVRMVEGSWRGESSLLLLLRRRRYIGGQMEPRLLSSGDGFSGESEDRCHEENRGRLGNIFPKLVRNGDEDVEEGSTVKRDLGDERIIFSSLFFGGGLGLSCFSLLTYSLVSAVRKKKFVNRQISIMKFVIYERKRSPNYLFTRLQQRRRCNFCLFERMRAEYSHVKKAGACMYYVLVLQSTYMYYVQLYLYIHTISKGHVIGRTCRKLI